MEVKGCKLGDCVGCSAATHERDPFVQEVASLVAQAERRLVIVTGGRWAGQCTSAGGRLLLLALVEERLLHRPGQSRPPRGLFTAVRETRRTFQRGLPLADEGCVDTGSGDHRSRWNFHSVDQGAPTERAPTAVVAL